MVKVIKLNLGQGDLEKGFPLVTATLFDQNLFSKWQAQSSLPASAEIVNIYQQWQLLYSAFLKRSNLSSRIKIFKGTITNISQVDLEQLCQQLALQLNSWLNFQPFLQSIILPLYKDLNSSEQIYIILQTDNFLVRQLPWHLWKFLEDFPQAELALSAPDYQSPTQSSTASNSVRILAILGNQTGINLKKDCSILQNLPNVSLKFLSEPNRQELDDALRDERGWDILFFAGHSYTEEERGKIFINQEDALTILELKYALKTAIYKGLKLAIFNSCDGLGLVQELEDLHIPQIIVMKQPVPDLVAQEFLKNFLPLFAKGQSFYSAIRYAREKLQALENQFPCASWLPVTIQNSSSLPLSWKDLVGTTPIWQKLISILLVSCASTSLVMGIKFMGIFQLIELKIFDQLMRMRPPEAIDKRILIVTVDEEDIQYQKEQQLEGKWSLSDQAVILLLKKLIPKQPSLIASNIYHDYPYEFSLKTTIKNYPNFIAVCQVQGKTVKSISSPPDLSTNQLGFTNIPLDFDGVVRRHLLGMSPDEQCQTEQSFSLRVALCYLAIHENLGCPPDKNYWPFKSLKQLDAQAGGYEMSSKEARGYQLLINYRSANFEKISLRELLQDKKELNLDYLVKNRIILIGTNEENKDQLLTPYSVGNPPAKLAGVFLHAHLISQLISYHLDGRNLIDWWPNWGELIWIKTWGILAGIVVIIVQKKTTRLVSLSIIIINLYGINYLFLINGLWLPFIPTALTIILTYSGTNFILDFIFKRKFLKILMGYQ